MLSMQFLHLLGSCGNKLEFKLKLQKNTKKNNFGAYARGFLLLNQGRNTNGNGQLGECFKDLWHVSNLSRYEDVLFAEAFGEKKMEIASNLKRKN